MPSNIYILKLNQPHIFYHIYNKIQKSHKIKSNKINKKINSIGEVSSHLKKKKIKINLISHNLKINKNLKKYKLKYKIHLNPY